jgi:hypothetical protein
MFEQPRVGVGLREIVDADEFEAAFGPLENGPRQQSADAPKPVYPNPCHE